MRGVISDRSQLTQLLLKEDVASQLSSVEDLALQATVPHRHEAEYTEVGGLFCDGIQVQLGHVLKAHA